MRLELLLLVALAGLAMTLAPTRKRGWSATLLALTAICGVLFLAAR